MAGEWSANVRGNFLSHYEGNTAVLTDGLVRAYTHVLYINVCNIIVYIYVCVNPQPMLDRLCIYPIETGVRSNA